MRETVIAFARGRLVGILAEPTSPDPRRPCVVLLNAGLLPRSGPGRLSVALARTLVGAGFAALRFDLSGLGDSGNREQALSANDSVVVDVREALDFASTAPLRYRSFILFGLCSGGVGAHYAAAADERVVGVVMLDGYVFPTLRSRLGALWDRARSPGRLLASVAGLVKRALGGAANPASADEDDAFLPTWPSVDRAAADLSHLVRRGVKLLYVYSGEWAWYRYQGQVREAFRGVPFGDLLTERRVAKAEHLYFTDPERRQMLQTITGWIGEHFGREDFGPVAEP